MLYVVEHITSLTGYLPSSAIQVMLRWQYTDVPTQLIKMFWAAQHRGSIFLNYDTLFKIQENDETWL